MDPGASVPGIISMATQKRTALALTSGSFTGSKTLRRYFLQAGKPVTEETPGDFDGVLGTYLELVEEPQQEEKPAPKKRTRK